MKKIALLLLIVTVAVSPAAAATKKDGKTAAPAAAQQSNPNEASWRLVKDGVPLVLPTWSLPIYFSIYPELQKKIKKM